MLITLSLGYAKAPLSLIFIKLLIKFSLMPNKALTHDSHASNFPNLCDIKPAIYITTSMEYCDNILFVNK